MTAPPPPSRPLWPRIIEAAAPPVLIAGAATAMAADQPAIWAAAMITLGAESYGWAWHHTPPEMPHRTKVAGLAGLASPVIAPARVAASTASGAWWLIGRPVIDVNRARWRNRRQRATIGAQIAATVPRAPARPLATPPAPALPAAPAVPGPPIVRHPDGGEAMLVVLPTGDRHLAPMEDCALTDWWV